MLSHILDCVNEYSNMHGIDALLLK